MAMKKWEIQIEGMSCMHCAGNVQRILSHLPGIEIDEVQVGRAVFRAPEGTDPIPAVREALAEAGYDLVE
jgi:copper chaperone CopZ